MSDFRFLYSRKRDWFLFEKEGMKYLSCQYDNSFVTSLLFFSLYDNEALLLEKNGYECIDKLALDVRLYPEKFKDRDLGEKIRRDAMKSVPDILPGD